MDGIVESILKGGRAVVMTFGQTGTGKSLTLSGLHNNFEYRGIIPRAFTALFKEKECQKIVAKIEYWMSCVEFEGNTTKDLLGPAHVPSKHRTFDILKDMHRMEIPCETTALTLLFKAESHRRNSKTAPYPGSHLGHCVVTIYVQRTDLLLSGGSVTYGKIHFIDLAGIDTGKSASLWKSSSEVGRANVVKSFLEQYLTQYSQHIPSSKPGMFIQGRVNKLIYYLADALTPSCIICLVGHIFCSKQHLNITLSTMKFGQKIRDGLESSQLHIEREHEPKLYMQALESEIVKLKNELEVISLLANDSNFCISQSCYDLIKRIATGYLQGNDDEFLTLLSYGQARLVLEVFRELYKKLEAEKHQLETEQQKYEQSEQNVSQQSLTKLIKGSSSTSYKNRKNRRSSRQSYRSAQVKSETSKTSTASQTDGRVNNKSQIKLVGETDNKGIGIGSGIVTSFEGAVAKSIKEGSSAEISDTNIQDEHKPEMCIKLIFEGDLMFDPDNMPPADILWQDFLNSAPEITILKNKLDNFFAKTKQAQSDYIAAATSLSDCTVDLENTKIILAEQQKEWYSVLSELCGAESAVTLKENDVKLLQTIKEKEIELKAVSETVKAAKSNLISLSKEKLLIKQELEKALQNYCIANYGLPVPAECASITESKEKINLKKQFEMLQKTIFLENAVLTMYGKCFHLYEKPLS